MTAGAILVGVAVAVVVAMVAMTAAAQRRAVPREPRPGDPVFRKVGPMQARGQAALVVEGATRPGDRVEVDGEELTVSEIEPMAGDTRAWLVPGPTSDRRQILDAEVRATAAAIQVRLDEIAVAAIATLSDVRYGPEMDDVATIRVHEALRREANYLRPWLVDVGVTSADALPDDALPRCEHVGDGYLRCDCAYLAHRIAERHVYG